MAQSLAQLRALTDEEVVRSYDQQAQTTQVGLQHWSDELNRRYQERQTDSMIGFTRQIKWMTVVITVATLANVGLTLAVLLQC